MGTTGFVRGLVSLTFVLVAASCSATSSSPTSAGPPLTASNAPSTDPQVSDGRILFGIENGNRRSMAYIDATGMHAIAAPNDPSMSQWAWGGPNTVLFTEERHQVRHAFRMPLNGQPVMTGAEGSAQENPRPSPDGSLIVYENYDPETNRDLGLQIANAGGGDPRRITPPAPQGATWGYAEPAFSPDGQSIAFARVTDWETGRAAIFVVNVDGTGMRKLTGYGLDAGSPRWSPDGKTILFTQGAHAKVVGGFTWPLWTVPVAGGQPTQVTHNDGGWSFHGDWSPDGNSIVYQYYEPGWDHNELRIISADGSNDRVLWSAPAGSTAETPDWR